MIFVSDAEKGRRSDGRASNGGGRKDRPPRPGRNLEAAIQFCDNPVNSDVLCTFLCPSRPKKVVAPARRKNYLYTYEQHIAAQFFVVQKKEKKSYAAMQKKENERQEAPQTYEHHTERKRVDFGQEKKAF